MPMAKKNLNTVARLAMGTAMLTVISGCENRVANTYNDLVSIPGNAGIAPAGPTTTVAAPQYVVPGAPTYIETSQAANVQTFESVYGPPISDAAAGTLVQSQPYAPPSYNDGMVMVQPLDAPVMTPAPMAVTVAPTYTQQTMAALEPIAYSDGQTVDTGELVYGDTLTSSSYTVEAAAPIVPTSVSTATMIEEPMAPMMESVMMDSAVTESYVLETAPAMPMQPVYTETLPMADAMAVTMDAPMLGAEAEPTSGMFTVISDPVLDPVQEPMPMMADPVVQPMPMPAAPAAPYTGGVEIISNTEALRTYDIAPAPVPGDQSGLMLETMPVAETTVPLGFEAYTAPEPMIETAALFAPTVETSPMPRQKTFVTVAAPQDNSPAMAPLPRQRPQPTAKSDDYATLSAPLPQPRPEYKKPMAVATTSGEYVSIGALPEAGSPDGLKALESVGLPVDAPAMKVMRDVAPETPAAVQPVREARVRTIEPKAPAMDKAAKIDSSGSELSGTSWRLVEVDMAAVSVNAELHFDGASGFAGGQGPCNSYGGEFVNAGQGKFSLSNIFSTDISCSSLAVEKKYLEALETANAYEIAPGFSDLTLLDGNGRKLATFKAF